MDIYKDTIQDINQTIAKLYELDLVRDYHPFCANKTGSKSSEITMSHRSDANTILYDKHLSAEYIIDMLLKNQQYTVLLYDKSIIQVEFCFENNELIKERLLFIKKHNRIWELKEITDADEEDSDWFQDEDGIPIFIRFDFDLTEQKKGHPASHLHISNHTSCRIPVQNGISFSEFVNFILLHFYDKEMGYVPYRFSNRPSITELEKEMLHIDWI